MPEVVTDKSVIRPAKATGEYAFFFSSGGRPLYAAFHPAFGTDRDYVLVICHAIGTEHMLTQRIEALAARQTAAIGVPALRYNARAHGDSAGEECELRFEDLVEDAIAAAELARQLSGKRRIIWLGIRLGCAVVAEAVRRRHDTGAVALWAPVHRGDDYVRSMLRATFFAQMVKGRRPSITVDGMLEQLEQKGEFPVVAGYVYRAFYRSVKDLELRRTLNWNGPTLIAQVQPRPTLSPDNECMRAEIEQRGGSVKFICIREEPPWTMLTVAKPQWANGELLFATKEWLDGLERNAG